MIAEQLFTSDGQLKAGFTVSSQRNSRSAQTYLSSEWVIQRRAAALYPAWKIRTEILSSIPDPQGLLDAAHCQHEMDEQRGCFWVRYRRIDCPGSPSELNHLKLSAEELEQLFSDTLPAVLASEELLRNAPVKRPLLAQLYRQESSKVHLVRTCSADRLRDMLATLGIAIEAPLPEPRPLALSHGDVLLKNIIATAEGYRLIDWEALGMYPADFALAHALTWIVIKIPEERWDNFIEQHADAYQQITGLNQYQMRLTIYWHILAETLFWVNRDSQFQQRLAIAEMWLAKLDDR